MSAPDRHDRVRRRLIIAIAALMVVLVPLVGHGVWYVYSLHLSYGTQSDSKQ